MAKLAVLFSHSCPLPDLVFYGFDVQWILKEHHFVQCRFIIMLMRCHRILTLVYNNCLCQSLW